MCETLYSIAHEHELALDEVIERFLFNFMHG